MASAKNGVVSVTIKGKKEKKEYTAVDEISFNVKKGEIIAFVGPNGAGKSTTIKMLSGIIHPTDGQIKVAGLNPSKQRKQLAYKIGCMFGQKSGLSITFFIFLGCILLIIRSKEFSTY